MENLVKPIIPIILIRIIITTIKKEIQSNLIQLKI